MTGHKVLSTLPSGMHTESAVSEQGTEPYGHFDRTFWESRLMQIVVSSTKRESDFGGVAL